MLMAKLKAVLFNCTLKPSDERSSTHALLAKVEAALENREVSCTMIHAAGAGIKFGTDPDMGDGDGWPKLHDTILASDILVIGTPIWFGQRASVCQMVLERIDSMLNQQNSKGQLPLYNKVAGVCVVGNEDGAQHVGASVLYNLMQTGATIPPNAETFWVGPAGGRDDFIDVAVDDPYPNKMAVMMASNLVSVAKLLKDHPIPVDQNTVE